MSIGWQDVLALAVVLAAVVCIVRRMRRSAANRVARCGTCDGCRALPDTQPLISLDPQYKTSEPHAPPE